MKKKTKSDIRLPSRQELLRVVRELRGSDNPLLLKAEEASRDALEAFMNTDKTYLRLKKACEQASSRRYAAGQRRRERVQKVRNLILLEGATPRVLRELTALVD